MYPLGLAESKAKLVVDTVKAWVKTWFFDVESKEEYDFSKKRFYKWLDKQLLDKNTPDNLFKAIKLWIGTNLDHYDSHWLNYLQLNVCGMNQCTSSISEALHSSMKSSFDEVQSNMSTCTSAMTQMTKAERRGNNQYRANTEQASRSKTWTSNETQYFLTDHCAHETEIEWILAGNYKVVQTGSNKFLVFRKVSADQ
jgi:hypothetical protein